MSKPTGTTESIFCAMLDVLVAEDHRSHYQATHRESGKVLERNSREALAEGDYELTHVDGHSKLGSHMNFPRSKLNRR